MLLLPLGFARVEELAARAVACLVAGEDLPAADDGVDVARVQFESVATPTDAFRRDHRGAAPQKRIENDIAPCRAVHDRIRHQRYGLHRRMEREQIPLFTLTGERRRSWIAPDVAP